MCERKNTVVFSIDIRSHRANAYQIHEWLYDTSLIREDDVHVIQIDGPLRKVYLNFVSSEKIKYILKQINDDLSFRHVSGDISRVKVENAGVGIRIRASTLPPEVTEPQMKHVLSTYGDIKQIQDDVWSPPYGLKVKNGVRLVDTGLKEHIPSHIKIEGH